jgi:RsiW-degrading membrane proteinase PrsW (M82 family)
MEPMDGYCPKCGSALRAGGDCAACAAAGRLPTAPSQHWALPDPVSTVLPHVAPHRRRAFWLALLLGGAALFFWGLLTKVFADPGIAVRMLVFGAFFVPVLFVLFMAGEALIEEAPAIVLVEVFISTAVVGNLLAVVLNYLTGGSPWLTGPIEEGVKFAAVVWLLRRRERPTIMAGILYGAAAGMGFAASENLSYFFRAYIDGGFTALGGGSQAFFQAGASQLFQVFWARSFFGPWLHGSWTAIVAGVAWREAAGRRLRIDPPLILTFIGVSGLHTLWDAAPASIQWPVVFPVVVMADVLALRWLIRAAHHQEREPVAPDFSCPACGRPAPTGARYCPACGRSLADALRMTEAGSVLAPSLGGPS